MRHLLLQALGKGQARKSKQGQGRCWLLRYKLSNGGMDSFACRLQSFSNIIEPTAPNDNTQHMPRYSPPSFRARLSWVCVFKNASVPKNPEQHEHDVGAKTYENGVACYFACTLKILFLQGFWRARHLFNACAYAYSDYQKAGQGMQGLGIFAYVLNCIICYPAYEIAVNDIVKSLNYH